MRKRTSSLQNSSLPAIQDTQRTSKHTVLFWRQYNSRCDGMLWNLSLQWFCRSLSFGRFRASLQGIHTRSCNWALFYLSPWVVAVCMVLYALDLWHLGKIADMRHGLTHHSCNMFILQICGTPSGSICAVYTLDYCNPRVQKPKTSGVALLFPPCATLEGFQG